MFHKTSRVSVQTILRLHDGYVKDLPLDFEDFLPFSSPPPTYPTPTSDWGGGADTPHPPSSSQ